VTNLVPRLAEAMPTQEDNPDDFNRSNQNDGGVSWRQALGTVGLALAIPWMMGIPALIGWWLDKKYATAPLWLIVGLVVGLVSTALDIYRLLKRFGQFR
jgi:putative F0F1-ATPase subunit (Ca2+/Mg2+ transporter)